MSSIQLAKRQLALVPMYKVILLLVLMIVVGFTEGIGILLLVPLLQIMQGELIGSNGFPVYLINLLRSMNVPITISGVLVTFILIIGVRSIAYYWRETTAANFRHSLVDRLRINYFDSVLKAEWRWIVSSNKADKISLLVTDTDRVGVGIHFGLTMLATIVVLVAYLLVAFILSWQLTLLTLVSGGVVVIIFSAQRRKSYVLGHELNGANRAMHKHVNDSLSAIKMVKILGVEENHLNKYRQVISDLRCQQLQFVANTCLTHSLFQFVGASMLAIFLYVGLNFFSTPVSDLLILVVVFARTIPMFASIQTHYQYWLHAVPAQQLSDQMLGESKKCAEPSHYHKLSQKKIVENTIEFKNVSVKYPERDAYALHNVSVNIPARKTTIITGPSGAGKSTFTDVLMGLLKQEAGFVLVDGEDIDSHRIDWRHSVAYVPQEVYLINDTIRQNLLWGNTVTSDKRLQAALHSASADFVYDLPRGLETVAGDSGVRLSGGERQRVALARALLKEPTLLILDEATSALDKDNERLIKNAVDILHGDLTIVIISHSMTFLEHADNVINLNLGKVIK